MKHKTLEYVMNGLMSRYRERVPDVLKIANAMVEQGIINNIADIENDHVAFRTMGVPQLGIQSFEKIFRILDTKNVSISILRAKNSMLTGMLRQAQSSRGFLLANSVFGIYRSIYKTS